MKGNVNSGDKNCDNSDAQDSVEKSCGHEGSENHDSGMNCESEASEDKSGENENCDDEDSSEQNKAGIKYHNFFDFKNIKIRMV